MSADFPDITVLGLTGGIATGKNCVATCFEKHGVTVIDADLLAREAVMPGSTALDKVVGVFGSSILTKDGQLDRKRLGGVVFADRQQRQLLENILHPEIRRLADQCIAAEVAAGSRYVVYMAPLLIEAGITDRVDRVWVVTVQNHIQLERLIKRDGCTKEQALQIISSQMPLAEKECYGDVIINNSGSVAETQILFEAAWAAETGNLHE